MKRVLVLQHVWEDSQGLLGEILKRHGIELDVVHVDAEPLPDPTVYGAIIALGGSQHVYEAEQYPYFAQEKALLRTIVEQDIPYLGICLGGQLLADVLGGQVKRHTTTEIGFYDIPLTEQGKRDPLYKGLPGYQRVFHWHEDIFDLPVEAVLLASSESTKNQAFRYGHRAYGLQYHIELDQEMLALWLHHPEFQPAIIDALGTDTYNAIENQCVSQYQLYREHTEIVFENFLALSGLL